MAQPLAVSSLAHEDARDVASDDIIVLRGATWADFQRLLELRGERPVPRLSYLAGVLELMSPSRSHESLKSMIGCLVEAFCIERGVDISPYGSWTLESKEDERGIEPDECYVLGNNPEPERPDVAIEVIWKSGSIDKLEIYRKLRVREVWVWRKGAIEVYALQGDAYRRLQQSELISGIDLGQLLAFASMHPMTQAVREYRAALRGE
jgi:Uma2 family endonuclease